MRRTSSRKGMCGAVMVGVPWSMSALSKGRRPRWGSVALSNVGVSVGSCNVASESALEGGQCSCRSKSVPGEQG